MARKVNVRTKNKMNIGIKRYCNPPDQVHSHLLPQSMHSLISLAILSDWIPILWNSISQILINSQFLGQLLMRRDEVWSLIIPHAFPNQVLVGL